jgi:signal peptidase I
VESTDHNKDIAGTSFKVHLGLMKEALQSGHSVELPALGYSMFPALKPGDNVIINPLSADEMPQLGSIIIYVSEGILIMHRLIEIRSGNTDNVLFITRGDSTRKADAPWSASELVGVAVRYRHDLSEYSLRTFIPSRTRYRINLIALWMYNKISRLNDMLTRLTGGPK